MIVKCSSHRKFCNVENRTIAAAIVTPNAVDLMMAEAAVPKFSMSKSSRDKDSLGKTVLLCILFKNVL